MRLELAASEFVSLRYNHLPTLQNNTRLIAYTLFVLCSSTCTIGNTRKIAKYNELFRRKLFRPWNLFISTGLIFTSYNCYFTNKNSCWSLTLLRPPSLIICIYCHAIQTSISLYKRYKIFNGREWKKITRYRSNLSYFIPFIFIFLILIFSIRSWIKVINVRGNLLSHQWIGVGFDVL